MPDHLQNRRRQLEEHYEQYDPNEGYYEEPPPPKPRVTRTDHALLFGFCLTFALGLASAILNFIYARGTANAATSIPFLHAEIGVLFLAMLFAVLLIWRGR